MYYNSCITFTHNFNRYGPATQVRWLQDPKPADKAAAAVAKRPANSPPTYD